ncbi:MAG: hypothetical protein AAF004_11040 [Pseudomonadota bacterium]
MHDFFIARIQRASISFVSCLALAGCFGNGDGPEPIAGTPAPPPPELPAGFCDPINFEDACPAATLANFAGGASDVIPNPQQNGINTSDQVVQMRKFADQPFGGTTIDQPAGVNFSDGQAFTMKVFSPRQVPVLFKFEGLDKERSVSHTGSNAWEELCFDFTNDTMGPTVTGITIIFDLGVNGDAANDPDNWTFLYDDITQVASCGGTGGGGNTTALPIDFEADPMSYDFGMDAGFGGGASTVIANPQMTGTNTSAQTAQMQKFPAEVFGGSTLTLASAVDFSAGEAFTMQVWAERAVPVLFKFEGLDKERELTHSGSGEWETLCFDFTGDSAGPATSAITFIFDNGTNGDATNNPDDWTFLFDDIQQVASCSGGGGGGGSATAAIDFETAATGSGFTWSVFENSDNPALEVIANPDMSGLNTSATVGQFTARLAGMPFAGAVTQDLPTFTLDATNSTVTLLVWKPVISDVGVKFENAAGGSTGEILVANTVVNQWEALTFDFSGVIGDPNNTDITGLVIFPDFNARTQENVIFFDDIAFSGDGSGGGGSGGPSAATTTDFEAGGTFVFNDFGGGVGSVQANPDTSGINPSAMSAQIQKFAGEVFGGTTLDLGGAVDFTSGEAYQVKVYATRSVDVLFKLEGLNQERTVTHGGTGWEVLCFDFAGTTAGDPATAITFIFDNGTAGDAAGDPDNWTFFVDDIEQTATCGGGGGSSAALAVDFEADPATYDFGMDAGFGGGASTVIANPQMTGTNTSAQTAQMQKFPAEVFGGSTLALSEAVDFNNGEAFTMQVWAQRAVPVLFKFEGLNKERVLTHSGGGAWETLCFDFTGDSAGPATSAITFIFDNGVNGDATNNPDDWTFLFDDIQQVADCGVPAASFPVAFEDDPMSYDFGPDAGFGGGASTVIANPDMSGINTSAQTARMQKFAAADFGGSTLALDGNVDFSAGEFFTMKVWATREVPVLFKFEGLNQERSVSHSGSGGWESLCFDFSGNTAGPVSAAITFIFDLGVVGDATNNPDDWTFYFDDIEQGTSCDTGGGSGGGGMASAAVDFESPTTGADFTWGVFENVDNPALEIIANPDASGANTSATVAQFTARQAGQPFAGTITSDLPTFTLDATNSTVTLAVWKSVISNVGVKFENAAGGSTGEILVANTLTDQWEVLTFDFSGVIGDPNNTDITGLVIFPDFDARTQENVIYFDNVTFSGEATGGGGGTGPTADASTDFEGGGTFTFNDFGGGVAMIANNPDTSGINTSASVAQFQKFAGETFGGSTLDLAGTVDFSAGEAYQVKVYATRSVDVLFKLEGLNQERTVTHGGTGWEVLCFDFTGTTSGDPATAITFIFDNGTAGAAATDAANWTFFADDIDQVSSCGGGSSAVLPVDFEADISSYVFRDGGGFGGGQGAVVANPDMMGNSSAQVGQMQKFAGEVFGGTTLDLGGTFDLPANSAFTMNVRATRVVPVLFKLEGGPIGEISVDHGGTGWETLCFDFGALAGNGTDGITLIFDLGTAGAAATDPENWTFYFDDITLTSGCGGGGGGGSTSAAIDFESASTGAGFTWSVFENVDNPALEFIANPDATGINTSATVAQFTARQAGQPFAGTITSDLATFTLDATNSTVTIMVWKSVISNVGIKFENGIGGSTGEILVPNTVTDQWEELTFDFSGVIGDPNNTDITGFIVFPDFEARTQENVVYFDNVTFGDGS